MMRTTRNSYFDKPILVTYPFCGILRDLYEFFFIARIWLGLPEMPFNDLPGTRIADITHNCL